MIQQQDVCVDQGLADVRNPKLNLTFRIDPNLELCATKVSKTLGYHVWTLKNGSFQKEHPYERIGINSYFGGRMQNSKFLAPF